MALAWARTLCPSLFLYAGQRGPGHFLGRFGIFLMFMAWYMPLSQRFLFEKYSNRSILMWYHIFPNPKNSRMSDNYDDKACFAPAMLPIINKLNACLTGASACLLLCKYSIDLVYMSLSMSIMFTTVPGQLCSKRSSMYHSAFLSSCSAASFCPRRHRYLIALPWQNDICLTTSMHSMSSDL